MILRTIAVSGWRCHIDPVNVGPFQEGLNVLYGPNATGKSTLFEALLRGLLDGHRVIGKEIEAIRPWGRSLAPTVTIEFSHEETDYRITKRYLDRSFSKLERKENGRFVALAEGSDADDRVRKILSRSAPGRGLAKPEHWGIAQVLWAPQGELDLGALSGDLITDIKASLGTQVSGSEGGPVEKRIDAIYSQIFTAGGKLKTGSDAPAIVKINENLEKATERRNTALTRQQQFDEVSRRIEDLRARRKQAKHNAMELNKEITEARTQAEAYRKLLSEKEIFEVKSKTTEVQYNGLRDRIVQIKSECEEIKEAQTLLQELADAIPLHKQDKESREKEALDSKSELENARKDRKTVDNAQAVADEARVFTENSRQAANLKGQIGKITELQQILASFKKERSEFLAPSIKDLRIIQKTINERDAARVLIDAALITLEVVPEREGSLEVISGEKTGTVSLQPGKSTRIKGSPEVVAELPGVARIRASGPVGSIEEHRKEFTIALKKLRQQTEPFGTDDLVELETLSDKVETLNNQINGTETQISTLLSERSLDEIERQRTRIELAQTELLKKHIDWQNKPPDSERLKSNAQEVNRSFVEKVEATEARWEKAQAALSAVAAKGADLEAQLDATEKRIKTTELRLAEFTNDKKTDEERDSELKEIALSWDAARGGLEEVNKKLAGFGADLVVAIEILEKQLDAADEASSKALEDEKIEEGRLQNLSAQGTYSNLAIIEEEIAALTDQAKSQELRVNAIRLLFDTVAQCHAETLSAVIGPIETAATRTMQRITGERLGQLKLGEYLEPDFVIPSISGAPVSLKSGLSGGEKEQIYLATRLALAELLAKEQRHLVVLDDVLVATDAGRLARVMTILEEAAQRLQILILTCHPERYRGLEGASFIDLEAILRSNLEN